MAFAPAGARRTAKTCGHGATHVWDGCHGTVATLWHTRRHCRKNFSAIVATDITVGLVVDQLGLAGCLPHPLPAGEGGGEDIPSLWTGLPRFSASCHKCRAVWQLALVGCQGRGGAGNVIQVML